MKTITRIYTIVSSPYFVREEASEYKRLSDQGIRSESFNQELLERYFNDIYKLFLRRLANLECHPAPMMQAEKDKLKRILDEIIKVKGMMNESAQDAEKF